MTTAYAVRGFIWILPRPPPPDNGVFTPASRAAGPWQSLVYCAGFIIRVNVLTHVPRVQIPPDPPICYHHRMKKKIAVEKGKFDAVLSQLLNLLCQGNNHPYGLLPGGAQLPCVPRSKKAKLQTKSRSTGQPFRHKQFSCGCGERDSDCVRATLNTWRFRATCST